MCITGFIWPLTDWEYVTFLQRFFFLENASLNAKIELVKLKPGKWKTQKVKRDCKWFSVWETSMNIMTNSLLCPAPSLVVWLQKGHHTLLTIYNLKDWHGHLWPRKANAIALQGRSPAASVPRATVAETDGDANPTVHHNRSQTPSSISNMSNSGHSGNRGTERSVITHHCFWFLIFSYQLAGSFCSSIQYFSGYIDVCSTCVHSTSSALGRDRLFIVHLYPK